MNKVQALISVVCVAGCALASDVVLNIQLNGQEMENGERTEKVMVRGILVIEDFGSETNVHAGTFYLLGNKKGKGKSAGYYTAEDAVVSVLSNRQKQFGMLVELDGAYLAGIGKAMVKKDGEYSQIIISSGQGAFLHADFSEQPVSTNSVTSASDDDVMLEELEVGKMQATLNKELTKKAKESDGITAVEDWFAENNIKERSE